MNEIYKIPQIKGIPSFKPIVYKALLPAFHNFYVFPGFCDVHVHFREPGFSYKETILTGTRSAARGGFTDVCTMPNLDPIPDSAEHLNAQLDLIRRDAIIKVHPYGAITRGEKGRDLADLDALAPNVIAFSDDGKGVQDEEMMRAAMKKARSLGKIIAAHCEDETLLKGGYIHDGEYAALKGHRGICSESEWRQIERDIRLAAATGCAYHICHISCKESVDIIKKAKAAGIDVTCETAPHYLLLDESALAEDGKYKMNPPLRSARDREALTEGLCDGTIDMIATDHAPHSLEEKSLGLMKSAFGIVGLETAFPALYTGLVKTGIITLEKLVGIMAVNPRKRFGIPFSGDYTVWDLDEREKVDPERFATKGRSTPFEGMELYGTCYLTVADGRTVFYKKSAEEWEYGKKN